MAYLVQTLVREINERGEAHNICSYSLSAFKQTLEQGYYRLK